MEIKRPTDSLTIMTELVLPNDTNMLNNLMGGRLLHWMDIAAAMSAAKHAKTVCVTAAVDKVSFNHPIRLGDVVTIHAKCVRAFNTSVEVYIEVWSQELSKDEKIRCNEAFYTFVALDRDKKPIKVPEIQPETEEERKLYEYALMRKQLKLMIAGKTTIDKVPELRQQFQLWVEGDQTALL
jgi:acyl-CoA hydrolase